MTVTVPDGTGGTKPCNTTGTAAGVEVVLTRPDDAGVGPCVVVRGQLAGRVGAAAFVGIHGDGAAAGGRGLGR